MRDEPRLATGGTELSVSDAERSASTIARAVLRRAIASSRVESKSVCMCVYFGFVVGSHTGPRNIICDCVVGKESATDCFFPGVFVWPKTGVYLNLRTWFVDIAV